MLLDNKPDKIIYYYNHWQPLFIDMRDKGLVHKFVNGLPTQEELEGESKPGKHTLIVIDDFMNVASDHVSNIFTALSHHLSLSCVFISQNLFARNNKYMRDMSLSATHLVLFKNPRDQSQIVSLARQLSPGNARYIIDGFRDITKKPYSYVVFDLHQATPEELRVRSHIFPHEQPAVAILPI